MSRHVRIGVLRLLDSAPVLLAEECGIFEKLGLRVEISIEPSWANVADKLTYGLLDAAVMLPPLVLAAVLGMGRPPAPLVVPMGISLGGNAVAMNPETGFDIWPGEGPLAMGRRLVGWMRAQPQRPRLAVVHAFSTHHLLLRYWLAASGADVAQDFHPVVVPPEHAVGALADGRVAAFCAGAPWGDLAEIAGVGRVVLSSSAIWSNHPEKCLAVAAPWAAAEPETLAALLRALLRAGAACDRPEQARSIVRLLACPAGLDLPEAASLAALAGTARERIVFDAGAAWFPWRSHALWFLRQMQRWRWIDPSCDVEAVARAVYRPDLLAGPARAEGRSWPARDRKPEGGHAGRWYLEAAPAALEMYPDRLCDGMTF